MTELNILPENEVIDKAKALELFGTEKQQATFKKTNKMTKNMKDNLERTLEQYYESFEEVKHPTVTRAKAYKLGALRNEVAERNSRQGKSAKPKSMLTETMEMHVIGKIINEDFSPKSKSLAEWLVHLSLIHHQEYNLYQANSEGTNKEKLAFNQVMDFLKSESDIFKENTANTKYDYRRVLREYRYFILQLRNNLDRTFTRLHKEGLITYSDKPFAIVKDSSGSHALITIGEQSYQNILYLQKDLKEKYCLSTEQIMNNSNDFIVKAYKKEFDELFKDKIIVNSIVENNENKILEEPKKYSLVNVFTKKFVIKRCFNSEKWDKYIEKHLQEVYKKYSQSEDFKNFVKENTTNFVGEKRTTFEDKTNKKVMKYENEDDFNPIKKVDSSIELKDMFFLWLNEYTYKENMSRLQELFNRALTNSINYRESVEKTHQMINLDELEEIHSANYVVSLKRVSNNFSHFTNDEYEKFCERNEKEAYRK